MVCPCKSCELKGCGPKHSKCKAYQDWKEYNEKRRAWLKAQMPMTSEGVKKKTIQNIRRRAKYGNGGKWGKGGDS